MSSLKNFKKLKDSFNIKKSLSEKFHEQTKLKSLPLNVKTYPEIWKKIYYKEYPRFPQILLPIDNKPPKINLFETLISRRSKRNFSKKNISIETLSKILYFSAGISSLQKNRNISKRMYPSAGARYPLEVYPIVLKRTKNLNKGIYHYNVKFHSLELLQIGNFKNNLLKICGSVNEKIIQQTAVALIITAIFGRTQIKYGDRSYRLILIEAGHLAQNIYLVTTSFQIGCCSIGGFIDDGANKLLDLETEKEQTVYIIVLGKLGT